MTDPSFRIERDSMGEMNVKRKEPLRIFLLVDGVFQEILSTPLP
jgi:hypothetical protein